MPTTWSARINSSPRVRSHTLVRLTVLLLAAAAPVVNRRLLARSVVAGDGQGLITLTDVAGVGGERSRGKAGTPTAGVGRRTRTLTAEHSGSGSAGRDPGPGLGCGGGGVGWS